MNIQSGQGYPNPALTDSSATEQLVAVAIAGVIDSAKAEGRSLDEITQEVLTDDDVLDQPTRYWLSQIVSEAWSNWPDYAEVLKRSA